MNSTPASDTSLYEIALGSDKPSLVLQLSPATLKSVFESFINLLVEQKIPAIVWVKLPRGDVWQTELERYRLLPGIARGIYQFRNYQDEPGEDAGMVSTTISPKTSAESVNNPSIAHITSPGLTSENTPTGIIPIQLVPESYLRREYFLVVWSTAFQGVVLAHRPRSAHVTKPVEPSLSESSVGLPEQLQSTEAGQDRRQHLLALCSLEAEFVQRILQGIEHAATLSHHRLVAESVTSLPDPAQPDSYVDQWQKLMAEMSTSGANLHLLGQLVTRQIQQQEEFWQRSATYRKQAEITEVLQIQNVELTNAMRLKDDFLNNVGQELRTPLTTIKTALTLLNSPNIKPPQRQRYMDLIAKECDRQSSLITSLLDLVHLEQVVDQSSLQPIRLVEVVPGVVSTYQPVAEEKGVKLAYTVPEDLPPVSCMNHWLKQIVINLLNNGIKYTPTGGQVWVRAKQQGDYIQLEFRDTGIGITPGEIPKIFERFYRVRQASEESISGAGLGLTIVQQLLLHCGGSISVRSKVGEGSTFNVLLPIHKSTSKPLSE